MTRVLKLSTFAFALLFSAFTFAAQGERKFVLNFQGQRFNQNGKIFLKQELQRQHGVNAKKFRLKRVKLVAKSRNGNGKAKLVVGQNQTRNEFINGTPRDFRFDDRNTWDRVTFRNPSRRSQGNWQIHMRGKIKVKRVVVWLERKRNRRPGPRPTPRPFPRPNPRNDYGKVCFYTGTYYSGQSLCLDSGDQRMHLGNAFNDEISSIRVFGGASATVCTSNNMGGRCKTFHNDTPQLGYTGDWFSVAFNDRISSMEVH